MYVCHVDIFDCISSKLPILTLPKCFSMHFAILTNISSYMLVVATVH